MKPNKKVDMVHFIVAAVVIPASLKNGEKTWKGRGICMCGLNAYGGNIFSYPKAKDADNAARMMMVAIIMMMTLAVIILMDRI